MNEASGDQLTRGELSAYAVSVLVAGASTALVMVNLGVAGPVVVAAAVFVMSGTATLAFLGVVDAGGTLTTGFAAALLVAARFGLIGIPLSQRFKGRPLWERLLVAFPVLDAAAAMCFREDDFAAGRRSYIRTARVSYAMWVGGIVLGVLLGSLIPDPRALGMDVAFPALLWRQPARWPASRSGWRRRAYWRRSSPWSPLLSAPPGCRCCSLCWPRPPACGPTPEAEVRTS